MDRAYDLAFDAQSALATTKSSTDCWEYCAPSESLDGQQRSDPHRLRADARLASICKGRVIYHDQATRN